MKAASAQLKAKRAFKTHQDDKTLGGLSLKAIKKQHKAMRKARKNRHNLHLVTEV